MTLRSRRNNRGGQAGRQEPRANQQNAGGRQAPAHATPTLKMGSRGTEVQQLQTQLEEIGFSPKGADGVFGRNTDAAVREFQKHNGLSVDGIVGPQTQGALGGGRIPKAIPVQEGRESDGGEERSGGLGGFLGGLFGGGRNKDRQAGGPEGRRASSGRGIPLPESGFTVPTSKFYATGMSETALKTALTAFDTAWSKGQTKSTVFTLVDFTKSDDERRLWVVDLKSGEVLHNEFCTHGYGSDGSGYNNHATQFSNTSGSGQSSLGLMRAGRKRQSYGKGREGTAAMEVDGLERGFNDNVRRRSVIMHEASNQRGSYVNENGVGGASAGCWALDPKVNAQVIASIPSGSLMFNYFPSKKYLENSTYLKKKLQS